ncbi:MAG TPA: acetyl-CoA C-acetyltransferase [Kofleriaceae bacterium]|jgi:acetyl-CoA C-acetyltransferase|nr:acetyl-CoA C-acetyltransferase [Kofleriaceae bacterium]
MTDVFIFDALRTPRGRGKADKGGLAAIHPQELLAQTLNHMADRRKLDKSLVEDLAIGCVTQVKEQGSCIARNALIAADWPEDVTGVTVNRFCGSGLEAVNTIAGKVGAGFIDAGIGGGVESMSRVPMGSDESMLDGLNLKLRERLFMVPQGISADLIATREGFTRDDVDKFALASQQKAARAIEGKRFDRGMFTVANNDGSPGLARDEHPRADTTLESLGQLKPAFEKLGAMAMGPHGETVDALALVRYADTKQIAHVHTAGNSSGIVDGAAVVLLGSGEWGVRAGQKPRAKIRALATAGAEPLIMLTAPTPASQKALKKAGMSVKDIDLWEINEAFAVVPLQTARALGIDPERINVNGGAIALGHPLGATGAILLGTVLDELERTNKATALITLCIGGGMGIATIIERV